MTSNRCRPVAFRTGMILVLTAFGLGAALTAKGTEQPEIRLVADTVVDEAGLNFEDGAVGTCINGQTFQQEGLLSFQGHQYAAYWADGGVLCVARRRLPDGPWEVIRFKDYSIDHNDVHNVVVIGICPGDGTIHLAFDHHGHPLHYRRSVSGLALQPEKSAWKAAQFGKITSELEPGKPVRRVTYPQFFSTPQGKLQLIYRVGASGKGDWYLAEYGPEPGRWTVLGMFFSGEGSYETSPSRCAYVNPPRYGPTSRLHVTWCWRERPAGKPNSLLTNHDLGYAYSDDFGRTWKDNEGRTIAVLGGPDASARRPITIDTPGHVVRHTEFMHGQMNTVTQFVDAKDRPHVIHWQHQQDAETGSLDMNPWRYYHYWRDAEGAWHENRLPFYGRKPQIVLDGDGNAYVVFGKADNRNYHNLDPGVVLHVARATEKSRWTDWQVLWSCPWQSVGEPLVDPVRWSREGILSVYTQQMPEKPGVPSPLHVLDFEVGCPVCR
jgi:hypothetical protein